MLLTATVLAIGLSLPPSSVPSDGSAAARVEEDPPPAAVTPKPATTISFRWENDVVSGTDENYSNGFSISVSRDGDGPLGRLWRAAGLFGGRTVAGYEIGQLIVTPRDISLSVPDPLDRPYAGLLYLALSTQHVSGRRFDGLKLITGMVGPASGAAETQIGFHRLIHNPRPQGWSGQLRNEPILNMVYEHRRRFRVASNDAGWSAEFIPTVGGMLGNVLTQVEADAQLRFGFGLPDDFGTTIMRGLGNLPFPRDSSGARRSGVYAFLGGGANAVARNLTLDGNTFQDGPRVEKRPFFPAAEAGVSIWLRRVDLTLTYVWWGREYESQVRSSKFGAATVSIRF